MDGILVLFIVLFGLIFLFALVIAIREEVRIRGNWPKRTSQWNYQKIETCKLDVCETDDFFKSGQNARNSSDQTIDKVMKIEPLHQT